MERTAALAPGEDAGLGSSAVRGFLPLPFHDCGLDNGQRPQAPLVQ